MAGIVVDILMNSIKRVIVAGDQVNFYLRGSLHTVILATLLAGGGASK